MTDNTVANIWGDIIRTIYRLLDTVVYWLLGLMYQIFFNVASAELFTNETVKNFYGRVQLILGVFMIFKLAVSIVKGIVNPDTFVDKKEGMGNIIYRIMFSLVMLTIIAPINIPNARNEYEIQLNNNGLLFGTLYSLQNRILSNNTLGRLILGTTDGNTVQTGGSNKNQTQKLKDSANLFTSTILKGFIRINLKDGKEDETKSANWMCQDLDEDTKKIYTDLHADPELIIGLTSKKCDADDASLVAKVFNSNQRYMFAYRGLISAIVGGVFVYILLNFTIDIAVRAIKLAILRLLAPIPIIAYIDPSGEKQAFSSWTKLLTSTYLDLFLRLAIIYFVIFLVEDITKNGLVINQATGVVGILTYIFIFLGLFIFAKQAPKFIKQVFGMKDDGGKMFGGLGEALGAVGRIAAPAGVGLGMIGAAAVGHRAAAEENAALHPGSRLNGLRNFGAGLANAIGSGYAGAKAIGGAKDHHFSAAMKAMDQHNATRAAHSTLPGRFASGAYGMFTGQGLSEQQNKELKYNQDAFKAFKSYKSTLEDEALKKTDFYGQDKTGSGNQYNYRKLEAAVQRARNSGAATFDYSDGVHTYTGLTTDAFDDNTMNDIKSSQATEYAARLMSDTAFQQSEGTAFNAYKTAKAAAQDASNTTFDGQYKTTKAAMGEVAGKSTTAETDMRQIMRRANDRAKK